MTRFRQLPSRDEIFLDHIAHWLPDMGDAAESFERLGFTLTPYTEHANSPAPGEPVVPAGSANCCVMLREGYLELLTPTADTPIGRELRGGIARYVGLHLAAFACGDAAAERERLIANGFAQRPVVDLRRQAKYADGRDGEVRFTVVRPVPGAMAEGRIQFLTHHSPDLLWEERWLDHPNTAERLTDLFIAVEDPDEASARFERYLGRPRCRVTGGWLLATERGRVAILGADRVEALIPGLRVPVLPFMAGYALACGNLKACKAFFAERGIVYRTLTGDVVALHLPEAVGGTVLFTSRSVRPFWIA